MASKKYRGKLCVYCRVEEATTADHVFARQFFQVKQRHGLPKVPSCRDCNSKKSELEHYLTTILPFGATHANAEKALSIDVPRRLQKNRKLHAGLQAKAVHRVIENPAGQFENRLGIELDPDRFHDLAALVALGLMWHHWKTYLSPDAGIKAFTPSKTGLELMSKMMHVPVSPGLSVDVDLASGMVKYRGIAYDLSEGASLWGIQLLGGITLTDEEDSFVFSNSLVVVATGPREFTDLFP